MKSGVPSYSHFFQMLKEHDNKAMGLLCDLLHILPDSRITRIKESLPFVIFHKISHRRDSVMNFLGGNRITVYHHWFTDFQLYKVQNRFAGFRDDRKIRPHGTVEEVFLYRLYYRRNTVD
jgi:hypothetical protein